MGMVLGLTTISDGNIERLLADPPLVWLVVAPDDRDLYEDARREQKPSFLAGLFGRPGPEPPPPADLTHADGEGVSADLDKAWHGIHYLLTGTADGGEPPLSFLVTGGQEIGEIEVGYGPARAFTAAETQTIADAFARMGDQDLLAGFDPPDMMAKEIYPEIWDRTPPADDPIGYLREFLPVLRSFLRQAADARMGMVVTLT
jgi:hypothetical protein